MSLEWEYKKLGKLCSFEKEIISPIDNIEYIHYSFPAFDNNKEPEIEMGKDIKSSKFIFKKGDILYNKLNVKFKRVWNIDFDITNNSICSTEFIPIQSKDIDRDFLYYSLISPNLTNEMKYLSTGTSNSHQRINPKDLKDYDLFLPKSKDIQHKIGYILKLLDKRIAISMKINHNLDALCHIIFKHYFIDFTPFIDKGFVDSEIGEIPKEWAVTTVGNILDCKLGGTPSRSNESYWDGDIAWINSGKINEFRIIEPSEYITEEGLKKSATKLLPAKTTVIAITGATLGQISLLEIDSCANQSVIGVIPNKEYPYEFVYPLISSILDDLLKHQTGGAQQHINKNNVESFNIVCPPKDIISKYTNIVSPLYSQISTNCFEIEKLQKLRDTLLPKLMSGEIDVSKINCDLKLIIRKFIFKIISYLEDLI